MPRINAPTVAEHRVKVRTALVDAAEDILRQKGIDALTAGDVSSSAGISRNSLYRYVDSVNDLLPLVLGKHLPQWLEAVTGKLAGIEDPAELIVAWSRENLRQASRSGHGWLMGIARRAADASPNAELDSAHSGLTRIIADAYQELDPSRAEMLVEITYSLLAAGFRLIDEGHPVGRVEQTVLPAVRALTGESQPVRDPVEKPAEPPKLQNPPKHPAQPRNNETEWLD